MNRKQNNEIENTLAALRAGKTILYPTDTVWGLGCDATNITAIQQLYSLKKRSESKSMIVLVNDFEMLSKYLLEVPKKALHYIAEAKKPITIIYNNPINIASNIIASDNTLAIRMVQDPFCEALITRFGKPIVSTSANISGQATPNCFSEISKDILLGVAYVVNLHRDKESPNPSSIIKIDDAGSVIVIRE
jgi:L-threonylcarbamoyladenylate synthase